MLIYLLVILLILLFQDHLLRLPKKASRNKMEVKYLKVVCWILVLLAALRGSSVGSDTMGYIENYNAMPKLSFANVLLMYKDYPGYYLLAKTCSLLHFPVQILMGVVEGIYIYAIYQFINRYSRGKLYSILCFEVIGLYAFSLAGLKQTLSMAFVLLYFISLTEKKYIKTILLALAAYFCHHASLIFLFGIALYYMRNLRLYYLYLTVIVAVTLLGTRFIWTNMLGLLDDEHYSELYMEDEGYSSTTMIFYGVCLLFLFLFSRNYMKRRPKESRVVLGMSTLAFAFQAFALVSSAAFRFSLYFLPFMIVGFPNDFNRIGDANVRRIVKFAVAFMIVFFFVYSNRNGGSVVPYRFFWQ